MNHPLAFEFLRRDCANISTFFYHLKNPPSKILPLKPCFDFITEIHSTPEIDEQCLRESLKKLIEECAGNFSPENSEDLVFLNSEMPTNLGEIFSHKLDDEMKTILAGGDVGYKRYLFDKLKKCACPALIKKVLLLNINQWRQLISFIKKN